MAVWNALLLIGTLVIIAPMIIWSVECAAALLPYRVGKCSRIRPRVAVLVPAHNEEAGIGRMLQSVMPQLMEGDRLVVIADHCSDATAKTARELGCVVFERHDPLRQGKPYSLDDAVRRMQQDAPEVFVVIDADCVAHPGAIDALARLAYASHQPVQAKYILEQPSGANAHRHIAAFAFLIKNFVRPRGLQRLGLGCLLNGSGMAFTCDLLRDRVLVNNKLSEDTWFTIDLALRGHVARFCPQAEITSTLPIAKSSRVTQSTRWAYGSLQCVFRAPVLLLAAIRQRRLNLLGLFCDLLVPPLSLLMVLWLAILPASVASGLLASFWLPLIIALTGGAAMAISFGAVCRKFGRTDMHRLFLGIPSYIAFRAPIFINFLFRRQRKWVRTARDPFPPRD